jgi:putative transcriptional regulator
MKRELFSDLVASIKEAGKIREGKVKPSRVFKYNGPDIQRVREKMRISQSELACMIGVSKATLQNWEQGRRNPRGAARALLRVFEKDPKAVVKALG